jgi:hypothetical protein
MDLVWNDYSGRVRKCILQTQLTRSESTLLRHRTLCDEAVRRGPACQVACQYQEQPSMYCTCGRAPALKLSTTLPSVSKMYRNGRAFVSGGMTVR